VRIYHVRHNRDRVPDPPGRVQKPRHCLVFEIVRVDLVAMHGLFFDGLPPLLGLRWVIGDPV